jgi:hypothetical protein
MTFGNSLRLLLVSSTALLAAFKLIGVIGWSWWLVLFPIWIWLAVLAALSVVTLCILLFEIARNLIWR